MQLDSELVQNSLGVVKNTKQLQVTRREIKDLLFIISEHSLNNKTYAGNTVLIAHSEGTMKEFLEKVVKEGQKKGLTIDYKKRKCMVVIMIKTAQDVSYILGGGVKI